MSDLKDRAVGSYYRCRIVAKGDAIKRSYTEETELQRGKADRLRRALSICLGVETIVHEPRITLEGMTFETTLASYPPHLELIEPRIIQGNSTEARVPIYNLADLGAYLRGDLKVHSVHHIFFDQQGNLVNHQQTTLLRERLRRAAGRSDAIGYWATIALDALAELARATQELPEEYERGLRLAA